MSAPSPAAKNRKCRLSAWTGWLLLLAVSTNLPAGRTYAGEFEEATLKWRAEHEAKFSSPTGWLALSGHYWLKGGENRFGSSESDTIKLPKDLNEPCSGVIKVEGSSITLEVHGGGHVRIDGSEATESTLKIKPDEPETDGIQKIEIGDRVTLQLVRRAGRLAIRVRDSRSELLTKFQGKKWFEPDKTYVVTATFRSHLQPVTIKIKNVKGDTVESKMAGVLDFELQGHKCRLDAISEGPDSLFVIFKDETNGAGTYEGGRFLDVEYSSNDSRVTLDFNRAYQPPCAFNPHTLCPIPPKENHLNLRIEAGERR